MGSKLTYTVKAPIASFRSADKAPIESLKLHFLPKQEGSGDPSPTNVRPITGWTRCNLFKAKKNIGHIIGYSTSTINSPSGSRLLTNAYGTTISTINFSLPDTSLVITQTDYSESTITSYKNGYIAVGIDNLIYGKYYDFSFKVTNILSNPRNASLYDIKCIDPYGIQKNPTMVKDNIVVFKNMSWKQNTSSPERYERCSFEIRICGMSFTLSEFMVTPANKSDGVFEPYSGEQIPIVFPVLTKNLFDPACQMIITSEAYSVNGDKITQSTSDGRGWDSDSQMPPVMLPAGTYTISCSDGGVVNIRTSADGYESNTRFGNGIGTFTIGENVGIKFKHSASSYPKTFTIQIESGSVATEYEPFLPSDLIYGGYYDLVKGKMVIEFGSHIFDGTETNFNMNYKTSAGAFFGLINDTRVQFGSEGRIYCNKLKTGTGSHSPVSNSIAVRPSTPGYMMDFIYTEFTDMTLEEYNALTKAQQLELVKTYLADMYANGDPLISVFKLITPIEYDVNHQELQVFLDYNNFWSDMNDDTEVEYCFADRLSERKLIMNTPHIASASDSVDSFSTDMKAPLEELKVRFTPVQEGTGDPSPTNKRPIYGKSCFGVFQTNDNLVDYTVLPAADAANASHSFNEDKLTVSVKTAGSVYNVTYQTSLRWNIPEGLRGKTVRFVCGGIVNSNSTHHGVMIGEFRKKDETFISDPTIFSESNNTISRSYTIPADAVYCVFIFRMNQSTTVTFNDGDYITFQGFGINYDSTDTVYHKYTGQKISVIFPTMKNLLNIGLTDSIKPGATGSNITISAETGVISIDAVATSARSYVVFSQIFPPGTYTIQAQNDGAVAQARALFDIEVSGSSYNSYYGMYAKQLPSSKYYTFTLSESSRIGLVLSNGTAGSPGRLYNIQLESGSTATTFVPYEDVFYGGYIDLIRGKIVAEWMNIFAKWSDFSLSSNLENTSRRLYTSDSLFTTSTNSIGKSCNIAKFLNDYATDSIHFYTANVSNKGRIYLFLPIGTDENTLVQVCAPLLNPIEYDITPELLKSLKGQNNIFADTNGNVDVKYWTH